MVRQSTPLPAAAEPKKRRALISPEQIRALGPRLRPGDVMLSRREWYLSNIGLPGFWPHAALYVGTPEERRAVFAEARTREWVRAQGEPGGDLEAWLEARYAAVYRGSTRPKEEGHAVRVIEAMSEGVSLTTLEHSAACDSLAVLRPRLDWADKARAVTRAFHLVGRPYDFNFDFRTDAAVVCTK